MRPTNLSIAIAGLGAVGMPCARALDPGESGDAGIKGLRLTAVSARDQKQASKRVNGFSPPPQVVGLHALPEHADVVVECVPARVFRDVAEPVLRAGKTLVAISVGALLTHWDLVDLAVKFGGSIHVPSGALLGLDAVQAARRGTIHRVRIITTKPPAGLAGAPHLKDKGIDLGNLQSPRCVFAGSAREGASAFPANVNVAAALGLAGLGADATELEVWADPNINRNRHRIIVESDSADMELVIENVPSDSNPRTGRIVAQSVLASLEKFVSPLVIGT